jgi:peptide/nickel transport system substrate-binding protein
MRLRLIELSALCLLAVMTAAGKEPQQGTVADVLKADCEVGSPGGRLVIAQRAEPKTLQPVLAVDAPSREVIRLMTADLIHINRRTHKTEPALAKSWTVSEDGRRYTLLLRRGLKFSDGHVMDADDVIFTYRVYLDEKVHSPQRDLLIIDGLPIAVAKKDMFTLEFDLPKPYAAAERLFDSIAILPRHLLAQAYAEGKIAQVWGPTTDPVQIAGMGPFRLRKYTPGDRIVLERNPYYWKSDRDGHLLPYLEEVVFLVTGNEDAQVMRFKAGETDVITRISPENFSALSRQQSKDRRLVDLGPGLEYNFLFFNLNKSDRHIPPQIARKQAWFQKDAFRQAISAAIDREAMVRLAFQGRAAALTGHVTPGNKLWLKSSLPGSGRSVPRARELLSSAGFRWNGDGGLVDSAGEAVEFTILTSAGNYPRMQMATLAQSDLKDLGITAHVVTLEFQSLIERVLKSFDYEACLLGLGSGDADPNSEMNVLLSGGATHLWNPAQDVPATPWEAEIDQLMKQQLIAVNYQKRKSLYDRVQELMADKLPLIYLASPDILVGAKESLGNFKPATLDHYVLWNVEELYWRGDHAQ